MEMWIVWLIVIAALLIIEVLTQMMWALCLAIGTIAALIGYFCGISLAWQIILLAVGGVCSYIFLVPTFQKWHALSVDKKGKEAQTGMDALLGRRAFITEEVRPDKLGRVKIDGDCWQVKASPDFGTLSRGTEVVVTSYDSIILNVEPYKNK